MAESNVVSYVNEELFCQKLSELKPSMKVCNSNINVFINVDFCDAAKTWLTNGNNNDTTLKKTDIDTIKCKKWGL